ncbi:MAG: hypothetical protein GY820_12715 [Gammaproteobacteria bacterium]|nr:hypothetical protein [Bacteroidota bacterium]MCP4488165.1 hypothetical protein [Gammaproteobacteria bacterium]
MINFAEEKEQPTGGCIPEDSICLFRMEIRQPTKEEKKSQDPWVSQSDTGIKYLDCCFEVTCGAYKGRKIFEVIALPVSMQTAQLTAGHVKWANGSGAKLRAITEAVRGIDPKDQSRNAMIGRAVNGWHEFNGMIFPVKVGYKKIEDKDKYVNNRIRAIITPNRDGYQSVMDGGEIITDKPIPEIVHQQQPQSQGGYQQGGYGGYQQDEDLGPAFPSESDNLSDVPF